MGSVKARSLLGWSAFAASAFGIVTPVGASVAERVVAVVGEHAVLLSDMRQRARPFLMQIQVRYPAGAQQAAAESELFKHRLQRIDDERVDQQATDQDHL